MATSKAKLFTYNYIDLDILLNTDVSSENANFPVTNAYNLQRRSKVWRSQGYFKIVSGDNTIVFNEGGSDLTATVAPGEYSSISSFMTALDTAFTTAPGATGSYSISQDAYFKFIITKSAGTFNIKWTHANSADMANILGFSTSVDDTGALSYTADALRINTDEWILWDMGLASNPTAFFMCDQRNRPLKLSPNGTFYIQGNESNDFTTPTYSEAITYDDEIMGVIRDSGLHTQSLRYWRVKFMDQNPNGYIQIGAFFLGTAFEPSRGRITFPLQSKYDDRSIVVTSEGGQSFSDIYEQTQEYTIKWQGLEKEDKEDLNQIFSDYGVVNPFFISLDTDSVYSESQNRMFKFVKFSSEPQWELVSPNNFSCTMTLREDL
jgi:hypothetical protein